MAKVYNVKNKTLYTYEYFQDEFQVYNVKNKTLYTYEYFQDENSYNNKLDNLPIQGFRSSLTTKLPTQDEVDDFNNSNSN